MYRSATLAVTDVAVIDMNHVPSPSLSGRGSSEHADRQGLLSGVDVADLRGLGVPRDNVHLLGLSVECVLQTLPANGASGADPLGAVFLDRRLGGMVRSAFCEEERERLAGTRSASPPGVAAGSDAEG